MKHFKILFLISVVIIFSCSSQDATIEKAIDSIAESYVKLVLKVGQHNSDYVAGYWGPEEWKPLDNTDQSEEIFPTTELTNEVSELLNNLEKIDDSKFDKIGKLRLAYLNTQLLSVQGMVDFLSGKEMTYDEESKALFDVVAPQRSKEYFDIILRKLNDELPGEGDIYERFTKFKKEFIIPEEKIEVVFNAAIAECRNRTSNYVEFPKNEGINLEYVTGKPWSGMCSYNGDSNSLVELNKNIPIPIDFALRFASHEVYPGHHTHYSLLDNELYRTDNWVEFSIDMMFSPLGVIAEGIAIYAIEVAFPGEDRIIFERDVLFPLAGMDNSKAEKYYNVLELIHKLDYYKSVEAGRSYIDGKSTKEEVINGLMLYCLMAREKAEQSFQFIEQFRTYGITYAVGTEIVKNYIENNGGTSDNPDKRWELFVELLSTPQTPSGLL